MKIVMTLLARDEEDIIGPMIEYHLMRGVDFIIATDNRSVDGTQEILRGYQRRGLLHYIYEPDDDYAQTHWVTRMARMACVEFQADWVINSDADEFWWPDQGDLSSTLERLGHGSQAIAVKRTNFVPRAGDKDSFFADLMTFRETRSTNPFGHRLPDKVCHRAFADITVAQGNHGVYREGRALPADTAPLTILHFPLRTYGQFANKISKGGAAYCRNTELPPQTGMTWRKLYEVWERGELPAFYRSLVFDDQSIERGLRDGSLVSDDRLKHFLVRKR